MKKKIGVHFSIRFFWAYSCRVRKTYKNEKKLTNSTKRSKMKSMFQHTFQIHYGGQIEEDKVEYINI